MAYVEHPNENARHAMKAPNRLIEVWGEHNVTNDIPDKSATFCSYYL